MTLLHLSPNVITLKSLLHLRPNVITLRSLLHLRAVITFRSSTSARNRLAMLSDSESQLFVTQSGFSGSRTIDLSENNFESLFADTDNEKAVDNFSLHTEDVLNDVFTDKEDSGRSLL